jgi:hypothetical protein
MRSHRRTGPPVLCRGARSISGLVKFTNSRVWPTYKAIAIGAMRIDTLCRGSEHLRQLENARGLEIEHAMLNKASLESRRSDAVQPGHVHRHVTGSHQRRPQSEARLNQLRRAPEPHNANIDAPLHSLTNAFSKEPGEPRSDGRPILDVLQLCARIRRSG